MYLSSNQIIFSHIDTSVLQKGYFSFDLKDIFLYLNHFIS